MGNGVGKSAWVLTLLISIFFQSTSAFSAEPPKVDVIPPDIHETWSDTALTIQIPSEAPYVTPVQKLVVQRMGEIASSHGLPCDKMTTDRMQNVVEDIVNNAVVHGNALNPNKKVTISLSVQNGFAVITVADEGESFYDPHNDKDPRNEFRFRTPEDLLLDDAMMEKRKAANHDPTRPDGQGGRGIFLTDGLLDNVGGYLRYEPVQTESASQGTRVTIGLPLPKKQDGSSSTAPCGTAIVESKSGIVS